MRTPRQPPARRRRARAVSRAAATGSVALAVTTAVPGAYLGVVSLAGLVPVSDPGSAHPAVTRFAVMVPAHDEEAGIGRTLDSLRALDYPTDLFAVHVVADNCTDRTADVVRASGWTAHERDAPDDPGKGPALNWLLDRLVAAGEPFDALVVVDADTTLDTAFLSAMDAQLQQGVEVAQGYYSVRDAERSTSSGFRYAALACRHHLRPLGRNRLGGSSGLYGNGMVFSRRAMVGRRWTGHLVEDAELQNELLLDGQLVTYVPGARLWAEMPETLAQATSQNQRWERGRIEMARRYVPRLLVGLGDAPGRRLARLDAVADHLVPPLSVLVVGQLTVTGAHAAAAVLGHGPSRVALAVDVAALAALAAHVVAGLASVGAPPSRYVALLAAPKQVLWKVRLWAGTLGPDREVTWTRTRRNSESST